MNGAAAMAAPFVVDGHFEAESTASRQLLPGVMSSRDFEADAPLGAPNDNPR
jgi:hypothetical protein